MSLNFLCLLALIHENYGWETKETENQARFKFQQAKKVVSDSLGLDMDILLVNYVLKLAQLKFFGEFK